MSRPNVGDKVRIRYDLRGDCVYNDLWVDPEMVAFAGKEMVVSEIDDYYADQFCLENGGGWYWNTAMLEGSDVEPTDI